MINPISYKILKSFTFFMEYLLQDLFFKNKDSNFKIRLNRSIDLIDKNCIFFSRKHTLSPQKSSLDNLPVS